MLYATQQDLLTRFKAQELIDLTDEQGVGEIDSTKVNIALVDADSEINSYLVDRYTLPLTQTSEELVRLACDIARYKLWDVKANDLVKARYDAAISKLRDVSRGVASLGIDQASKPLQEAGSVKYTAPDRVFNSDSLAGF